MTTSSRNIVATSIGFIPLSAPELRGNEWRYVKECLDTGWVSSAGSFVDRFEKLVAERVGTEYAVATVNGTSALHVALLVAGVQPGDEVLVSTLSFIAPANAIRYVGAWPVFVDAEPVYWQMDPEKVVDFLERRCQWHEGVLRNRETGRRVSAIIPVHILGHPVDMEPILDIARKYALKVIGDATESLGSKYRDVAPASLGDIACLSFNGNKIITTGGGGMIVTDNGEWARKAKYLTTQAKDDEVEYVHDDVGYNYRLTNIQAALGCAQMEVLDEYVEAKRRIGSRYARELSAIPGAMVMREAPWAWSTFWMSTVLFDERECGIGSRGLMRVLSDHGIQSRPLWQPLHCSPAHAGAFAGDCSVSERLNRNALSLPCSVGISEEAQSRVIEVVSVVCSGH